MKRRAILKALFALILCGVYTAPVASAQASAFEDGATAFVNELAEKAIGQLTDKSVPRIQRIARFRKFFNSHFAVKGIGKWILGRHWRKASDSERAEYLHLFEDLMVMSYVDRFATYTGEPLRIEKTLAQGSSNVTVFTEIDQPGGAPNIHVDWRVARKNSVYKVVDVIVEGTSMSSTLRSDFGSTIRQRGGHISGLLTALREKTESLNSATK